jgi:hypothetical protein
MAHLMAEIDITKKGRGAFASALSGAEVGDEIVYHIGEFAGGEHKRIAMTSCEAGLCVLCQRRDGDRRFIYIAKKINKRRNS